MPERRCPPHEFIPMCEGESEGVRIGLCPCPPVLSEGDFCQWCLISWREWARGFGSNVAPLKHRQQHGL